MKGLVRLAVGSAAVACAVYTIVYLYRWEWHRAIVAGLFLAVAEVALATAAILQRLGALERRLSEAVAIGRLHVAPAPAAPSPAGPSPAVLDRVRDAAPPPRPPFAWLAPDRLGVFLPILLGAGVLASALAWAVESLARATARPALECHLAWRLTAFALPAGGLLGPAPAEPAGAAVRRPLIRWWWWPVGVLAVALVAYGIDELSDATQSRPDVLRSGVQTVVELELQGELAGAVPTRVTTSLWHACVGSLRERFPEPAVTEIGPSRMQLVIPVDIGEHTVRRLHGCLEDAGLDRIQAAVVTFRSHQIPE